MKEKTNVQHVKKIVLIALFAAITCVFTMIHIFPSPNGYVHIGDCIVLLSGFLLGPIAGGVAGGVGSALADLIGGYPIYIIPTLIIKFFMAFLAAYIVKCFSKMNLTFIGKLLGGIVAEVVMVLGYYIFDALIYSGFIGAFATVPGNLFQGGIGIVFAIIISELLRTSKMDKKLF